MASIDRELLEKMNFYLIEELGFKRNFQRWAQKELQIGCRSTLYFGL
jgi:hypothetical protein